jgi:hypothetical protein
MEGTVIMDYQLTIAFAKLGHRADLLDRVLAILLERLTDAGPVLAHNRTTGELEIMLAFTSSTPIEEVSRLSKALGLAMVDAGLSEPLTIIGANLAAVHEDDDRTEVPRVLSPA